MKNNLKQMFHRIIEKRIFLSYSSSRSREADIIEKFFEQNAISVVRDKNEKKNFENFMNQISDCDYVVFLLCNAFFDSIYCNYEMLLWKKRGIKAIIVKCGNADLKSEESRRKRYEKFIGQKGLLNAKQLDKIEGEYENFEKYNQAINSLLNIQSIDLLNDVDIENVCNDVYERICNRKAYNRKVDNIYSLLEMHLHDTERISDENLRQQFMNFLVYLIRCKKVFMSMFPEDIEGEEYYKLIDYRVDEGQIGASFQLEVEDMGRNIKNIEIHDICEVERNKCDYGDNYIKFYFCIKNRFVYRDYIQEKRKNEKFQDKGKIEQCESTMIERQRCKLIFEDRDAMNNVVCDKIVFSNYINE